MDISLPAILPTGIAGASPVADATRLARASLDKGLGSTQSAQSAADPASLTGADGGSATQGVMQSFSTVLAQALQDINQTQQAADAGAAKLAAGEPVDLHQVMIGMESANLSLGLALQVRNKLLDAYQEIMRMTI